MLITIKFDSVDQCSACGLEREGHICPECGGFHQYAQMFGLKYDPLFRCIKRTCPRCGYTWHERMFEEEAK